MGETLGRDEPLPVLIPAAAVIAQLQSAPLQHGLGNLSEECVLALPRRGAKQADTVMFASRCPALLQQFSEALAKRADLFPHESLGKIVEQPIDDDQRVDFILREPEAGNFELVRVPIEKIAVLRPIVANRHAKHVPTPGDQTLDCRFGTFELFLQRPSCNRIASRGEYLVQPRDLIQPAHAPGV